MDIRSYYHQCMYGAKVPVSIVNGTAPYTFEILPNALNPAGGTISPTGIYSASNKSGVDTIQVTDSLGEVATFKMQVGSYLNAIVDIIRQYIGLDQDQVIIYNQKFTLPPDSRAYIAVREVYTTTLGKSRATYSQGTVLENEQTLLLSSNIDVSIYTSSLQEFEKRHLINMALSSVYSERQQELNGFKIGLNPTNMANAYNVDGSKIPYFSNLNYNVQYKITRVEDVPYFNGIEIAGVITNA